MNRDECAGLMAYLASAYSSNAFPESTIEVFYRQLVDLPIDDLMQAAMIHVDTSTYPPKVADLRAGVSAIQRPERRALPAPTKLVDDVTPLPWYVRLQWARQREGKVTGYPLLEDQDQVRAECATRGIEIDVWPEVPRWYGGERPGAVERETDHTRDCPGWLLTQFNGNQAPEYEPCGSCHPGRAAVWRAGLMFGRWDGNEEAVKAYVAAELDFGNYPKPPGGDRTVDALWRRVIKDRGL